MCYIKFFSCFVAGKKTGVNIMCSHPLLAMHMICFRAGFDKKNLHSLYDYCMKQEINDKRCGMVLAGWLSANHDGNFRGGHPPTLSDITTNHEQVDLFVEFLFLHEDGYSIDIKKILCASIFRFYEDFIKLLSFHPDPKKELKHNHPFMKYISIACNEAHISEDVFKKWCSEVRTGFYKRNVLALDIQVLHDNLGSSFYDKQVIDTRTFLEIISDQGKSLCTLRSEVRDLKAVILNQSNQLSEVTATLNSIASRIGAKATDLDDKKCLICYPCKSLTYEDFQNQWKEGNSIEDKIFSFFSNKANMIYKNARDKSSIKTDYYKKKSKVNDELTKKGLQMNFFERNIGEDQKAYLSRIKALLTTTTTKNSTVTKFIPSSTIKSLFSPVKSTNVNTCVNLTTKLIHPYEKFCLQWSNKKKVIDKVKTWFMFRAQFVWETFPFKDQKKWLSGFDAKKNLIQRILVLSSYENQSSIIERLEDEDENSWSMRTNLYFVAIGNILKENNTLTVTSILEMDKKRSANSDNIGRIQKKQK